MNRKYLATLAGAALLILIVGLIIKPSDAVQVPVPEAEGAQLQQLSQERSLRVEANYFAERTAALAPQVVYVAEQEAPGVRWDSAGLVITTRVDFPVLPVRISDTVPVSQSANISEGARWVVALARQSDGKVASAISLYGGSALVECNGQQFREMIVDFIAQPALAGAGLFDLNGRRLGMIVHCGDRLVALPNNEVQKARNDATSVTRVLQTQLGATLSPLAERERSYFGSNSGLLVTLVKDGGAADAAGMRPGDIIVALNSQPVTGLNDLATLIAQQDSAYFLTRRRAGQEARVRLSPAQSTTSASNPVELIRASGSVLISRITPGTMLYRAGLRNGDRVIQIGNSLRPDIARVRRVLLQADSIPVFVVIQRGQVRHGLLISR